MSGVRVILLGLFSAFTVLAPAMAGDASTGAGRPTIATAEALQRLDGLFEGLFPWVAQLHDPESGGFYETLGLKQGKEDRPYAADIQSTHFAVNLFRDNGLLSAMPTSVREGLVHYFQSREDADGYFSDPAYPEMRENARTWAGR